MKKPFIPNMLLCQAVSCLIVVVALFVPLSLKGQSVITAQNIALGGGGTAYLSGYEATFYNPANLAIPVRTGSVHIGFGHGGALFDPVDSHTNPIDQASDFADYLLPYEAGEPTITATQRNRILSNNYPRSSQTSQHRSRMDLILGGLHIQKDHSAYSIVARTRVGSRFRIGRGWYDSDFVATDGEQIRNFTLNQQRSQLYELSLGYAREFTFINGLFPRLNKLFIGLAPKVVFSGPRFDANYQAQYVQDSESSHYRQQFSYRSSGSYTELTDAYRSSTNPQQAIDGSLERFDPYPTGIGVGLDFGLTYLIPLNSNIPSLITDASPIYSKSLRFAFSITDLGLVQEQDNPLSLSLPEQTLQAPEHSPASTLFRGAGGQYLSYLHSEGAIPNPVMQATDTDRSEYLALLPTTFNAGLLLDLFRLKLMGDVSVGLSNTAFSTTALSANVGVELRPLKKIPLRAGSHLASNMPVHIGIGTGYESRHWDFQIGTQIYFPSESFTPHIIGGGFAGIQLHL